MIINSYKSKDFDLIFKWIESDKARYYAAYEYLVKEGDKSKASEYWYRFMALESLRSKMKFHCDNTPNEKV